MAKSRKSFRPSEEVFLEVTKRFLEEKRLAEAKITRNKISSIECYKTQKTEKFPSL